MKKIILFTIIIFSFLGFFIFSCGPDDVVSCLEGTDNTIKVVKWGTTNTLVNLNVCKVKISNKAEFYIDRDNKILTPTKLEKFATEFDTVIYPKVTGAFGTVQSNLNGNGKINIVMYDINDGGKNQVRGYVNQGDLDPALQGNDGEYFYVDIAHFDDNIIKSTLAHEFQHIINQSIIMEENPTLGIMETWLDEGLAMAAEHLVYGASSVEDRVKAFNTNNNIRNANNVLLAWTGYENYALSYVFVQWVRWKANSDNIYKNIINEGSGSIQSVIKTLSGYSDFESILKQWAADNLTNGSYDDRLSATAVSPQSADATTSLRPSGVVYSVPNSCIDFGCELSTEGNIRGYGVKSDGTILNDINNSEGNYASFVINVNTTATATAENIGTWISAGADLPFDAKQSTEDINFSYNPIFKGIKND